MRIKFKFLKIFWICASIIPLLAIIYFSISFTRNNNLLQKSQTSQKLEFQKITIKKVHDGDTFFDEQNNSYRLFGVDTPEISNQYNDFQTTKGLENIYAEKAKTYAENLLLNKEVQVLKRGKDKYDRTIAQFKVENKDLALSLVKEGLARVAYISSDPKSPFYTTSFKYHKNLLNCENLACQEEKGFWEHKDSFKTIFPKKMGNMGKVNNEK